MTWRMHWAHLKLVLLHKWYVLEEGYRLGVPLSNLILHDWDKFLPDTWNAYVAFWLNPDGSRRNIKGEVRYGATDDAWFDLAWLSHVHRNRHHWQHWCWLVGTDRHGQDARYDTMQMPEADRAEMLADWIAAARANQGWASAARDWYMAHRTEMVLHPATRAWIEYQLGLEGDELMVRASVWTLVKTDKAVQQGDWTGEQKLTFRLWDNIVAREYTAWKWR